MFDGILLDDEFVSLVSGKLTQARLIQLYTYDPETGNFYYNRSNRAKKNDIAGYKHLNGYIVIRIDGKPYMAHRLAFLYMEGKFPAEEVDHINSIKTDNRWSNLRPATSAQNKCNTIKAKISRCGARGVQQYGKKFHTKVRVNRKYIYLGSFETRAEAEYAYLQAREQYFGEFNPSVVTDRLEEIAPMELEL